MSLIPVKVPGRCKGATQEPGAQGELMQTGKAPSSSPDWGGQFASQEESQALGDRPLSETHC